MAPVELAEPGLRLRAAQSIAHCRGVQPVPVRIAAAGEIAEEPVRGGSIAGAEEPLEAVDGARSAVRLPQQIREPAAAPLHAAPQAAAVLAHHPADDAP